MARIIEECVARLDELNDQREVDEVECRMFDVINEALEKGEEEGDPRVNLPNIFSMAKSCGIQDIEEVYAEWARNDAKWKARIDAEEQACKDPMHHLKEAADLCEQHEAIVIDWDAPDAEKMSLRDDLDKRISAEIEAAKEKGLSYAAIKEWAQAGGFDDLVEFMDDLISDE